MILPSGFSSTSYSTLANGKGWGSGWPNCSVVNQTITMKRSGQKLLVNQRVAKLFSVLLNAMEARGYLLHTPEQWSWGSECRAISGTNTPSNHSWGLAVDINAPNNPYTTGTQHDIPDWAYAMFRKYGFGLGADYSGKRDYMHVEFMGTPGDADIMTALAVAEFGDDGSLPGGGLDQNFPTTPAEETDDFDMANRSDAQIKSIVQDALRDFQQAGKDTFFAAQDNRLWKITEGDQKGRVLTLDTLIKIEEQPEPIPLSQVLLIMVARLQKLEAAIPSGDGGGAPAATQYTVVSGDTLSGIAAKTRSTVEAISAANGISDPNNINIGQVLTIPK